MSAGEPSLLKNAENRDDPILVRDLRGEVRARLNQRRAGRRAKRKYEEFRKEWLRRARGSYLALLLVLSGVWAAVWLYLRSLERDFSDTTWLLAGFILGALVSLRWSPPPHVQNWELGAFGEQATAKELRSLETRGWVVLHDLANGSANFDHVAIGPPGIFCINSKWSGYDLHVTPEGTLVGRHRYDPELTMDVSAHVRRAKREAVALQRKIVERCGERVWVTPVVAWWGEVEGGGKLQDGVGVVEGKCLVERLENQQGRPVRNLEAVLDVLRPGRHAHR